MNGRLRRACIRCARRIGSRESVKFAEEYSAAAESGGRPCLDAVNRGSDYQSGASILDEICQTEGMLLFAGEACYIVVGDDC